MNLVAVGLDAPAQRQQPVTRRGAVVAMVTLKGRSTQARPSGAGLVDEGAMVPPLIDMTNPEAVLREISDDDRQVKDQFAQHLAADLMTLSEALAACFRLLRALNDAASRAEAMRTALVAAFVFGVLDDVLTSTKLLVAGKLLPAGNLMRQVIEGIAMASLCSTDELLIVAVNERKPPVRGGVVRV